MNATNYHTSNNPGPRWGKFLIYVAIATAMAMLLLLNSCKTQQQLPVALNNKDSSHSEILISYRDTTIFIPADTTAWVHALAECDSLGNVKLTNLQKQFGRRSEATVSVKDNVIVARCIIDSMSIYLKMKETYKSEASVTEREIPIYIDVPAKLTWWQQFKVNFGGYALISWLVVIVLIIVIIILKIYGKVQYPLSFLKK